MKKYLKEIIILLLQVVMFYISPLFSSEIDMIGLVTLNIIVVLVLSVILGILSKNRIKFLYPIVIAILFIPAVFIYYNNSALIYPLWFLIISYVGIIIGIILDRITLEI